MMLVLALFVDGHYSPPLCVYVRTCVRNGDTIKSSEITRSKAVGYIIRFI